MAVLPYTGTDSNKKYRTKFNFTRFNTRTNQIVLAALSIILFLYATLLRPNSSQFYVMPSIDNIPHILLVLDHQIEYHNSCKHRMNDLISKLTADKYHVSVMLSADNTHGRYESELIESHINIIPYHQLINTLNIVRIDDTPEITAVITYLWFWTADTTISENIIPLLHKHSPGTKHIVFTDDIHYTRQIANNELLHNELIFMSDEYTDTLSNEYEQLLQKRELSIYNNVDHIVTVTEHDRTTLQSILNNHQINNIPISTARWGHNVTNLPIPTFDSLPLFWHRTGVCYLGNGHIPLNYYSMKWFFDHVYNILYRSASGPNPYLHSAPYYLLGPTPNNKYQPFTTVLTSEERASQRIRPLDISDDIALMHELQQCRVIINPIQKYSSGINIKIIHAMAAGTPIITTQLGARTIDLDTHIKLYSFGTTEHDTPESMAALITRLYSEPQFHEGLVKNGLAAAKILQSTELFNIDIQNIITTVIPPKEYDLLKQ